MVFDIVVKPIAYLDLEEAIDWYENQSLGLGKRFFLEFERCIDKIKTNPNHYRIYYKEARRILLSKFPYKIYYRVSNDAVIVLGIYHGKRSRTFVNRRLRLP